MHGQNQTSPLLSRDCAFVSEEPRTTPPPFTNITTPSLVDPTTNTITSTISAARTSYRVGGIEDPNIIEKQTSLPPSSFSSPHNQYHHHQQYISSTPPPPLMNNHHHHQAPPVVATRLLPSTTLLYERDHNQYHHSTVVGPTTNTTNATIPSLNTTLPSIHHHHYNNTGATLANPSPNVLPTISLHSHHHGDDHPHSTTTRANNDGQTFYPPTHNKETSNSTPSTPTTRQTTINYYPTSSQQPHSTSGSSVIQDNNINNNYYHPQQHSQHSLSSGSPTPTKTTNLPPFPPVGSDYNRSSAMNQAIRTHASSPSLLMTKQQQGMPPSALPPPHSPVGIISRSSAYPPHTQQSQQQHHHHQIPNGDSYREGLYGGNSQSGMHSSAAYPTSLSSAHRPVPSYVNNRHNMIEVDTIPRPLMEPQEQNLYPPQDRNSKNPNIMMGKNQSKQVEHKSCIICGKADTGNKYISYTINESNIEQYKGCFRHVPEIRIGDGVCKNCYAKKYKYVTGLSINKVKRKNGGKSQSIPDISQPPPSPVVGTHVSQPQQHANTTSSSSNTNHHYHGSSLTHHATPPTYVSSANNNSAHYPHDDYSSRSKYYDMHAQHHHDVPMHAHYSSSSAYSSHPHQHAHASSTISSQNYQTRSPPQSPPMHPTTSRKSHHYHPYASNENSQYLNGTNSTSSGGSNQRGNIQQDPFRSSPIHTPNHHQPQYATSPKSPPRSANTSMPSIMEMMGTAPPSYSMSVNNSSNNNYINGPLNAFNNGQTKHENVGALPRLEGTSPLSSHRYHPYSNSSSNRNQTSSSSSASGREDTNLHSPRIYSNEHLQNSPNPSPVRVASIVSTGPALPTTNIPHIYSPPPPIVATREEVVVPIPPTQTHAPPAYVVKKEEDACVPKMEAKAELDSPTDNNLDCATSDKQDAATIKEEDKKLFKEINPTEPMVNVFLTFITTTGTLSPTTRLSIPKKVGLIQLKEIIQKRLQKNKEEEFNVLQIGDELSLGNVMLKKDENNFVEIDDHFCTIYRFEHHDTLKVSLIK